MDASTEARWPDVSGLVASQPWDLLIPHVLKAGASTSESMPRLKRYCESVLKWNRKVSNLISRNDERRILVRHILESIEPAHLLKESKAERWMDLGSGAGFPAIPIAILGVGSSWVLVESRRTKTLFLRKAMEECEISNVTVILSRLEDLIGHEEHAGTYDGFTSRATLTLVPTLALAASVVRPGGVAFLWKGGRREEEMMADSSWQSRWELDGLLGIGDGATTVARFRRK